MPNKKTGPKESLFILRDPIRGNDEDTVEIDDIDDQEEQTLESYREQIVLCPGCNKPVASIQLVCCKCGQRLTTL
ncbi:MAG: hypothetical protein ABIH67_00650 [Candidatus Uhrbacteria bacterium]